MHTVQAPVTYTNCAATIIMYNITAMDQYSLASVTVPASTFSTEISEFPDNGTSIIANRNYTITVSAISDRGTSYPSDPIVISKFHVHMYIHAHKQFIYIEVQTLNSIGICTYMHMYVFG